MKKYAILFHENPQSAYMILHAIADDPEMHTYEWRLKNKNTGEVEIIGTEEDASITISTILIGTDGWQGRFLSCLIDNEFETEEIPMFENFSEIRAAVYFDKISQFDEKGDVGPETTNYLETTTI